MSDDLWWSLFSENVEADLPFFTPSPQAAPELFEKDIEGLELDNDEDVQFTALLDRPLPTYHDFTPSLASPSESTCTTDFSEDPSSEYSSMSYSTSNYPSPSAITFPDVDFGSEYNDVDPKHNYTTIDMSFLDSFCPSPAISPYVHIVKDQSDNGPYRPPVGISPLTLSTAFDGLSLAVSMDPVCAASMQEARKLPNSDTGSTQPRTGPARAKFICPHCGHRKHHFCLFISSIGSLFLSSI